MGAWDCSYPGTWPRKTQTRQYSRWTSHRTHTRDCCSSLTSRAASVSHPPNSGMRGTRKGTIFSATHTICEGWLWWAVQPKSKEWRKSTVPTQIQTPKASWPSLSTKWLRVNIENSKKSTRSLSSPTLPVAPPRKSYRNTCRCQMKTWIYRTKRRCWRRHRGTQKSQRLLPTWAKAQSDKI